MFNPQCRITPYLVGVLEKIATHIGLIQQTDISLPLNISLQKDAVNRSVHSSTWIEGNELSLAQVAALSDNKDVAAEESQKREVRNCLKALRWILQNKTKPLIEQRLLKLHALMTEGLLPASRCGHYRDVQNFIVNAWKIVTYTPPPPVKVKQRMRDIFTWLDKSQSEHPVIRSAIFHHECVAVHPFFDGNGRVVRAVSQWLLFAKGYEPVHTLGLDEFFAQDRKRYYDMLQQTHDLDGDYTHWVEYVAQGLLDSVQKIAERLKGERRILQGEKLSLTQKQEELLKILAGAGALGSAQICQKMNINRARVNQLIAPLVKAGVVIQKGKTRAARYVLA